MLHKDCMLPFSLASDLEASPLGPESKWDSESSPFPLNINWSSMQPPMMWRASSATQPSSLDTSGVDTDAMSSKTDMEDASSGMQGEDAVGYGGSSMVCATGMGSSSSLQLAAMTAGMESSEEPLVMFDQLVVETEALVERMNSLSRSGGKLDDVPSLGVLLGIEDMNPSEDPHNSTSPSYNAGRTLDELMVSEPNVMDMLDWPFPLHPWKGEEEEDMVNNTDVSHSSLTSLAFIGSNRQHTNCSSSVALSNIETVQSLGATSDVDDLDILDDDTDANDESYVPAREEKRRRNSNNAMAAGGNGIARSGSPRSSSATDKDSTRQKKRNFFQSPPINEVVKLLGLSGRWRKYGRKVMKDCPYPAHYYKCAVPGCDAKRKVWYDSSETLQVQGKGDDHTHPPLSKSDVLGNHRMRRRKVTTLSPEGSLSPSSSASEEAADSFYSTADSRSAPASGGRGGGKLTGVNSKGKRVAWPRLPNPRWRFRRCTPEDQSQQQQQQNATGGSARGGQQLQLQLYMDKNTGKANGKKESQMVGSEDEGAPPPPKMGEWFDAFSLGSGGRQQHAEQQQLSLADHHLGARREESVFMLSSSGGANNGSNNKLGDSSSARPTDLGFDGLYNWQDKVDEHVLIFTPVYGRQHSWRRLRRQLSNDIMQFDTTF